MRLVYDWVRRLEDSSGIEGQWHGLDDMRPAVTALLEFTARYYLPFLQANASAAAAGNAEFGVQLAGSAFEHPTFKYQVKCFQRLKSLLQEQREPRLRELLQETGCLQWLK